MKFSIRKIFTVGGSFTASIADLKIAGLSYRKGWSARLKKGSEKCAPAFKSPLFAA
jgi:hypothetical protein